VPLSIKKSHPASHDEWDFIWSQCDYSTYFHSRAWAEIWQSYTCGGIAPDPKLIIFSDGKTALLPLSSSKTLKGILKNYISSPAGTFGGWISTDPLRTEHAELLTIYLTKLRTITWRLNPYDPFVYKCKLPYLKKDETHALNLESGFERIYRSWSKGHKSAAHKAHKARNVGVVIEKAHMKDEWKEYYAIYEDSLKRWGDKATSRYSWRLFEIIANRQSNNIQLWLAKYGDKSIAGALCFYAKHHAVYWHGAAYSEYFEFRPVNLLMFEVIRHACEKGYSWFDFNPSGGHEGVKAFKKSFGSTALRSDIVTIYSIPYRLSMKLKTISRKFAV
jgi:hypothetical protein